MLRLVLLTALPVAVLAGAYLALRPRVRRIGRRGRREPRPVRTRGTAARVAPFIVLGLVLGVSFAITGDTTGTAVCFGTVAMLVLAIVVDRWYRRRRAAR